MVYDTGKTDAGKIAAVITEAGYPTEPEASGIAAATAEDQRHEKQMEHANRWLRRAIAGGILWAPVEIAHWALHFIFPQAHAAHQVMVWVSLVTSTIAIVYVGSSFYKSAWAALRQGTTNMDTLIALGASVAYVYSLVFFLGGLAHLWPVSHGDPLYFMESTALLALISLGHYLEARARQSAGNAIRQLLNLTPPAALRMREIPATAEAPPGGAGRSA